MKKLLSLTLSLIFVVTTVFALPMSVFAASTTTVNLNNKHQTMNGFGASGCWWAKDVGGWENLDDIMALLYDKKDGIGLNIYRYNLGAGSDKDELNYRADRWAESFINPDGTYDWTRDANAQKTLASAKKFAGDDLRVTLFCNSAPVHLTKNGCGIGNEYWWDCNLESKNFAAFAQYGYDCVNYFQNEGYRVVDISPANEPYGHWCRDNEWIPTLDENGNKTYDSNGNEIGEYRFYDWAGQEGCFYGAEDLMNLYRAFIKKFKGTDVVKKGCVVSGLEAGAMGYSEDDWCDLDNYLETMFAPTGKYSGYNRDLRENMDTITMHSYWSSREGKIKTAQLLKDTYKGKYKVAETEYCQMSEDRESGVYDLVSNGKMSSGLTIEYGLALANIMYDDLTILDAVEWDWWVACAYGGYTDGLVYLNPTTHEIETSKRLYTMGNFSKFTDEGSVRVDSTTSSSALKSVAFSNPDGTVSIVFINDGTTAQQTALKINGLSSCYSYDTYVTDSTRNLEKYQSSSVTKSSTVTIPAGSITTVVVKPCSHSYKNTITKATLSANGKITPVCTMCDAKKTATAISYPKAFKLSATSYTYDGKAKKPNVTVKDAKGKTIAASNYTVTYSNNKNVGKATAKVTFKGNYSGTKTLTFSIKPKGTSLSGVTSAKKGFTVKWKKQATQTTGYQVQYSTSSKFTNAKTVTVSKSGTTSKKITKLAGKKKYYVRVRTYKTVSGAKYYSGWSGAKTVTTKK